ncbi:MAG: formylglycine-generating enzyme family protein [Rubripirellula sp.]
MPIIPSLQCRFFVSTCFALSLSAKPLPAADPNDLGVVDERPVAMPCVKAGDRLMIPYLETIPGTDVSFEMVPVPGGVFWMGSTAEEMGRRADEGPRVRVKVEPMWVGATEVSQREFREFELLYEVFVEIERKNIDTKRKGVDLVTAPTPLYDPEHVYEYGNGPSYPAVAMTQYAAQQYSKWLSAMTKRQYRLPAEAEWEYACRGGTSTRYSWGDETIPVRDHAWFDGNSTTGFERVRQKLPNGFGLYDMHGNVGEWTVNAYTPDGYAWLHKGNLDVGNEEPTKADEKAIAALSTIRWPKESNHCVIRGGQWDNYVHGLRSAARLQSDDEAWKNEDASFITSPWWFTSDPARSIGFRLVRAFQPLDEETMQRFWDHTAKDVHENVAATLEMGRGRIGVLSPNLLPFFRDYREKQKAFQKELKARRQLRQIRPSRPSVE